MRCLTMVSFSSHSTAIVKHLETPHVFIQNGMLIQANLTPTKAAELWPQVREQADILGMELVSPAVNFCYGDCVEEVSSGFRDQKIPLPSPNANLATRGLRSFLVAVFLVRIRPPRGLRHLGGVRSSGRKRPPDLFLVRVCRSSSITLGKAHVTSRSIETSDRHFGSSSKLSMPRYYQLGLTYDMIAGSSALVGNASFPPHRIPSSGSTSSLPPVAT